MRITSSDIAGAEWEENPHTPGKGDLDIEFHATGTFRYFGVPKGTLELLADSMCPGKFFLQNIKGRYAWNKLPPAPDRASITEPSDEESVAPVANTTGRSYRLDTGETIDLTVNGVRYGIGQFDVATFDLLCSVNRKLDQLLSQTKPQEPTIKGK